jgi:hypothetical protein
VCVCVCVCWCFCVFVCFGCVLLFVVCCVCVCVCLFVCLFFTHFCFCVFVAPSSSRTHLKTLECFIVDIFKSFGILSTYNIPEDVFRKYVSLVHHSYQNTTYHNFRHAFDVLQTCYRYMRCVSGMRTFFLLRGSRSALFSLHFFFFSFSVHPVFLRPWCLLFLMRLLCHSTPGCFLCHGV